jgi:hypothetical protein
VKAQAVVDVLGYEVRQLQRRQRTFEWLESRVPNWNHN